jgi:UDP-glucose 4-epimerase
MKILVTGGAGFIGSHLVETLVQDHEVMVIDNLSEGKADYIDEKAVFREVDVRDRSALKTAIDDFNPRIVYHLAAYNDAMGSIEQEKKAIDVNIHGTVNILEACVDNGVEKIVYASSGGLSYGDPENIPTSEKHNVNPVYPYGVTKNCGTSFIRDYSRRKDIRCAVCRLGSVYGPRANGGVVKNILEKLAENEDPIIYGDGTQTRDFVHVRDIVRGLKKAGEQGKGVFNLGTCTQTSVNELLSLIKEATNSNPNTRYKERWEGDIDTCRLSIKKAERSINWDPKITLEEGIKECKTYYMQPNETQ